MKLKPLFLGVMSATALLASAAQAYDAGDFIVRGGLASVNPNMDSSELQLNGAAISTATVDVNNESQLGLSLTYMLKDNIGIELLAATPFSHKLTGKGAIEGLNDFAKVKHLPPTLSVQYYPMEKDSAFQPYLGVGVNYTVFFSEKFINGADATYSNLKLDNSLGLAGQVGFDYRVAENWSLNATVWYMDINTTATFNGNGGSDNYKLDVELDPWVYMAGIAYHF